MAVFGDRNYYYYCDYCYDRIPNQSSSLHVSGRTVYTVDTIIIYHNIFNNNV